MKDKSMARSVAFSGMLFALALLFSWLESFLTPMLGLPPGVKVGLANIVVLYALLYCTRWQALLLVLLKAGFGLLTRGPMAGALSLCGGLVSFLLMVLLMLWPGKTSVWVLSVVGAVGHNLGQMVLVQAVFGQASLVYLPIMLVSGLVMGTLTALLMRATLPVLHKAGLAQPSKGDESQWKRL